MKQAALEIVRDRDLPPITGRGRKKGSGPNLQLLNRMTVGDSIWDVPPDKMNSIRTSAHYAGIKVMVRRIPHTKMYAIKRIQ